MRFWDASALIPLCLREPRSEEMVTLAKADPGGASWWATPLECASAFARARREGRLGPSEESRLRKRVDVVVATWTEVLPSVELRELAGTLLLRHPLRAADSLQLAAALIWVDHRPSGQEFVCLDDRLREAARGEGFRVVPAFGPSPEDEIQSRRAPP